MQPEVSITVWHFSVVASLQFLDSRLLNVRGSGMNVHQFGNSHMPVHLGLFRRGVRAVSIFYLSQPAQSGPL